MTLVETKIINKYISFTIFDIKKYQTTRRKEDYKTLTLLRPQARPTLILQNAVAKKWKRRKTN